MEVVMYEYDGGSSFFAGFSMLFWVAVYLYCAFCQFYIAKKVGHESPWWAFIPVLGTFQIVQLASKPWWWFFLFFIPFVNIVAWPMAWVEIAKARNKPAFWGVFMLIPFLNFIAYAVMAAGPAFSGVANQAYADKSEQERVNVN